MRNPYLIEGPAQISFSGGRSSGMMLCKIVEAHGTLPDDILVTFANTGKEREESLQLVDRLERHLGIKVHWIEYIPNGDDWKFGATAMDRWREVDFATASRNGEPFAEMIRRNNRPPTVVDRVCTAYLKTKPMEGFLKAQGLRDYSRIVGIRADEPRRIAKMRAREDMDFVLPLAEAGVTVEDVVAFWKSMPFDLEIPSFSGNCDLCHLKSVPKLLALIREKPERADWWIKMEWDTGKLFSLERANYATMKLMATQPQLFDAEEGESLPCECTD